MITPILPNKIISFKGAEDHDNVAFKYCDTLTKVPSDVFTRSQLKEKIYEEKLQNNPNTAFLYDPSLNYKEKLAILGKHPEIMSSSDIEKTFNVSKKFVADEEFFEIEKTPNEQRKIQQYFDLSREINKKNLDILIEHRNSLFTRADFQKAYGVSCEEIDDCVESGRLNQLRLYSKTDGKLQNSQFITLTSDFVETTLANLQKIGKVSRCFHAITACNSKPIMVNVVELSKLGFGNPKTLHNMVINHQLDGDSRVIKHPEGDKICTRVNLNSRHNEELLRYIRSRRCIELSDADNLFGLTKAELSNAFFDGNLKCYTDAVLIGDMNRVYIDLKCKQNIDALNKISFEKELLNGILPKNFDRAETSQRIKLAWYFAPNTRRIASEIANNDAEIVKIAKKKTRIQNRNFECLQNSVSDSKKNYITYKERIILKNFFAKVWQEAGEEEYLEALEKASQALELAKGSGINKIEDDVLRKLISSLKNKSKRDFLDLP